MREDRAPLAVLCRADLQAVLQVSFCPAGLQLCLCLNRHKTVTADQWPQMPCTGSKKQEAASRKQSLGRRESHTAPDGRPSHDPQWRDTGLAADLPAFEGEQLSLPPVWCWSSADAFEEPSNGPVINGVTMAILKTALFFSINLKGIYLVSDLPCLFLIPGEHTLTNKKITRPRGVVKGVEIVECFSKTHST